MKLVDLLIHKCNFIRFNLMYEMTSKNVVCGCVWEDYCYLNTLKFPTYWLTNMIFLGQTTIKIC